MGESAVRKNVLVAMFALLSLVGSLLVGNSAEASVAATPVTIAQISYSSQFQQVAAKGVTTGWNRGTIKIRIVLYDGPNRVADKTTTCVNETSCVTPPVSGPCTCPGEWDAYAYGSGPRTGGVTEVDDSAFVIVPGLTHFKLKCPSSKSKASDSNPSKSPNKTPSSGRTSADA